MAKKKSKYPANREVKSNIFKSQDISFAHYTSRPALVIGIPGKLSEEALSDLKAAIDETLDYHGL